MNISGKAFYFAEEGFIKMTEPGEPLPSEIANTNITIGSITLGFIIILLASVHFIEKKKISNNPSPS